MSREPVAISAAVAAVVQAVCALLVAFGVSLSPGQVAAVMAVEGAVAALVGAVVVRRRVWCEQSVTAVVRAERAR